MKYKPQKFDIERDSTNTRIIRALRQENAKLKDQNAVLNNEVSVQLNAMKTIARLVNLPQDSTMKDLPVWIGKHWPKGIR